ncbi:MAG: hypothetical protein ABIR71_06870 [Chthoniobacterales bacterium]
MKTRLPLFLLTLAVSGLAFVSCERKGETTIATATAEKDSSNEAVVYGEGFHKDEVTPQGVLRWVRQEAVLTINAPAAGKYRLDFRPITVFSPTAVAIEVSVNGQPSGTITAEGSDFAQAPTRNIEAALQAGSNKVSLKANRPEVKMSEADSRMASFGLMLPVQATPLP